MARILIVGSGAREHALADALARDAHELLVAPGNAGTAALARNVSVRADDVEALVDLARCEGVDLVVVGPEAPLVAGLVDALGTAGVPAFGPTRAAAQLEASKAFMKNFCARHGIPTAPYEVFDEPEAALEAIRRRSTLPVVKADGLCAGKGVVVPATRQEALDAVTAMMCDRVFGDAGRVVVLEDRLDGEEASFHVVTDGERAVCLAPAQDHKRLLDGDRGPNTGGMGAYAPAPLVTPELEDEVLRTIVEPTLGGLAKEGTPFRGVLFVGLMIDRKKPRVLEFNVRFGDPEASVLVPLLDGDWFELLDGAARGKLRTFPKRAPGAALTVVMAAEGYPNAPRVGDRVEGLAASGAGVTVLHAGTRFDEAGSVVTGGGRVLAVRAMAPSLREAHDKAYEAVRAIRWPGEQHRSDIGHRALGPPASAR